MDWKKLTKAQKVEMLTQQLKDIKTAQAVLTRFEQLSETWLKKVTTTEAKT